MYCLACFLQEDSTRAYVQQQLEWGRFWKLLEFSDRIDKLLEVGARRALDRGEKARR